MTMTLKRNVLRELIADALREHRADSPGECAEAIMNTLRTYAPKAFWDNHADVEGEGDKFQRLAEELIKSHAFDISTWEISAAYPKLSDAEVQAVDDCIGMAHIDVKFE